MNQRVEFSVKAEEDLYLTGAENSIRRVTSGKNYNCSMVKTQPFSALFRQYAERHHVREDDLEFYFVNILKNEETPASVQLRKRDTIMVRNRRRPAATTTSNTPAATSTPAATTTVAAPVAPSPEFPSEVVADLASIGGFPEEAVRHCLRAAQGNPVLAVEFLTNGIPEGITALEMAVDRLAEMGFDRAQAARAFLACDRNEALAVNFLIDSMGDDDRVFLW